MIRALNPLEYLRARRSRQQAEELDTLFGAAIIGATRFPSALVLIAQAMRLASSACCGKVSIQTFRTRKARVLSIGQVRAEILDGPEAPRTVL